MNGAFKPLLVILAFVLCAAFLWHLNGAAPKEAVPWRTDLAAALGEAQRLHQPVFIDFSASWCGPCQQMARETWTDPSVAAALKGMVPVKIDVDEHHDLAAKYGVSGIPAFRVLDAEGNAVKAGVGFMPPKDFLGWLNAKPELGDRRK